MQAWVSRCEVDCCGGTFNAPSVTMSESDGVVFAVEDVGAAANVLQGLGKHSRLCRLI